MGTCMGGVEKTKSFGIVLYFVSLALLPPYKNLYTSRYHRQVSETTITTIKHENDVIHAYFGIVSSKKEQNNLIPDDFVEHMVFVP